MFFIPIRTDRQQASTPWVNYTLIALNVLIFGLTYQHIIAFGPLAAQGNSTEEIFTKAPAVGYWLWPSEPYTRLYQFLTYQFLHVGWQHILFNMLFLYVFGNAVEDRLGSVGYLLFYLAGGVVAGIGHVMGSGAPVLGASGSVAAVTGAYLALAPLSNVTIFYWVIVMVGSFEVSSMVLILFRVVQDAIFQISGIGTTAYVAHLAGYAFGFVVGMALLLGRLLTREPYDMLALINQKRRRSQFQRLSRKGYSPWDHATGEADTSREKAATAGGRSGGGGRSGNGARSGGRGKASAPSVEDRALMDARHGISTAVADHDTARAASLYVDLLKKYPDQVMPQQTQLDLANQLMADGRYDTAGRAYDLFLETYPSYPQKAHIQLILGLILARYLHEPDRARTLLTDARGRLDPDDAALADQVLSELKS